MDKTHGSTTHRQDGMLVFYENQNSKETRHCFVPAGQSILSFHDGFTRSDNEQGWKPVIGMLASTMSDADIENEHKRLATRYRA